MQRKDDTAAVLKSRLEAFHRQTEPVSVHIFDLLEILFFILHSDENSNIQLVTVFFLKLNC